MNPPTTPSLTTPPVFQDPVKDPDRLAALYATGLLDSPPEESFDRLTRLARRILGTSVATISLVDEHRQFFKSMAGRLGEAAADESPVRETPLSHSLCQFVVRHGAPLNVYNTRTDVRTRDSLAVSEGGIGAYLGVPLINESGYVLGTLCAAEPQPRLWSEDDLQTLMDLVECVMTEIELRTSQERFERAVRGSSDGLWEWELKTGALFLSARSKAILGYTDHEVANTAQAWRALLHSEDAGRMAQTLERFPDGGEAEGDEYRAEYRMRHKNGDYRWILSRGTTFRDDNGRLVRLAGSHTDITEQRAAQEELVRARDVALSSARAKSEFLANMSHEIRTPMNGVLGVTHLLLDTPLSTEQREHTQTVLDSAQSLLSIINDILDFSKIESGALALERVPYSPRTVMEDAARLLTPQAQNKRLRLVCDIPDDLPPGVQGDPTRLRQVLLNLCGNAIKFTEWGQVTVKAHVLNQDAQAATLRFSVSDTGIGIPIDRLEAVFESFAQADNSTTRRYGGTGLGLTISRQLTELMGGTLHVESVIGEGSTFWLDLTLDKAAPANEESGSPAQPESASALVGLRVLLAEDNAVNRKVARAQLARLGCEITEAQNGAEAVRAVRDAQNAGRAFAVVLMDVQMPEMDGLEATELIRKSEQSHRWAHLPIIALTAHALTGDRERCLEAGMDDYLSKPVRPDELRQTLQKWVARQSVEETTEAPTVEEASVPPAAINRDRLWEACFGDAEFAAEVAAEYQTSAAQIVQNIQQATASGDATGLRTEAHTLKGASRTVGAEPLAALCANLERVGEKGELKTAGALLPALQAEWTRVSQLLEEWFPNTRPAGATKDAVHW